MKGRRIYFRGDVWAGYRVVQPPLMPQVSVAVPQKSYAMARGSAEIPDCVHMPVDVYRLVRYTDHTGIPELQYHLLEMRR